MRLRRILLWTTIGSLALGAALGIVIIFTWSGTQAGAATIASAILVGAFSLTALLCTIVLDWYRWVNVMWAGIGASALALMLWLVAIWSDLLLVRGSVIADRLVTPGASMTVLALWSALAGLLMLPRVDGCGYLLYHLQSDTCPECGRTAAASERWLT